MSKLRSELDKLKKQVKKASHNHLFFIPKDIKEEKKVLKKHKDENITIEMLKIYEW